MEMAFQEGSLVRGDDPNAPRFFPEHGKSCRTFPSLELNAHSLEAPQRAHIVLELSAEQTRLRLEVDSSTVVVRHGKRRNIVRIPREGNAREFQSAVVRR